jgi:dynein intermediate chain
MLTKPQEILEVANTNRTTSKTDQVSITCLDTPLNDSSTFIVGTEEGNVYTVNRFDRAGVKAGLNDMYTGHYGCVTALTTHPKTEFQDLFMSCSVDWGVSLWRLPGTSTTTTNATTSASAGPGSMSTYRPIHTFDMNSYVSDVKFSPTHPALFTAVDTTGNIYFHNMNHDIVTLPTSNNNTTGNSAHATVSGTSTYNISNTAINKVTWSNDAKKIAAGNVSGQVYVYDTGNMSDCTNDDYTLFQKRLWMLDQK